MRLLDYHRVLLSVFLSELGLRKAVEVASPRRLQFVLGYF